MNQITVTLEFTKENLDLLKQLLPDSAVAITPKPMTAPAVNAPKDVLIPTPALTEEPAEVSLMDVKAVCLQMSKAGRQAELKNAFAKFGGKKLSDIAPADYAALMKELGNG